MKSSKFLILGQSRSGTQLLRSLLDSHPAIHCDGELLHRNLQYTGYRLVRELLRFYPEPLLKRRMRHEEVPTYGFNLMFYHLFLPRPTLRRLTKAGWQVIHLMREDLLSMAFSYLISVRSRQWHRRRGDIPPTYQVHISTEALEHELLKRLRWRSTELELARHIPHMDVRYERDLVDRSQWQATCSRLFGALQVAPHEASTDMLKSDTRRHEEIVENFAELTDWLNDSEYPTRLSVL